MLFLIILFSIFLKSKTSIFDRTHENITNLASENIPSGTTHADFSFSYLKMIQANLLLSTDLPSLHKIKFNHNLIDLIENYAFANLTSLDTLFLEHNSIEIITTKMFGGCYELRVLKLTNNPLHTIENQAFWDTINLETMWLYYNELTTFPELAWDPDNHPTSLDTLYLYENDLWCDCSLAWLKDADGSWVTVGFPDTTYCRGGPPKLYNRNWTSLTKQELLGQGEEVVKFTATLISPYGVPYFLR